MRAKKKSIPIPSFFAAAKVKKGARKFTMDDLAEIIDAKKAAQLHDKRLTSFFEIYMEKEEAQQREIQARSSIYDAASPKESDAGLTPMSGYGGGKPRGFFKEQPTSTKNLSGVTISTPKEQKKFGFNLPTTPKMNVPGLDLSKLHSIQE